jgi:very-short-patch-repair endonuclease
MNNFEVDVRFENIFIKMFGFTVIRYKNNQCMRVKKLL